MTAWLEPFRYALNQRAVQEETTNNQLKRLRGLPVSLKVSLDPLDGWRVGCIAGLQVAPALERVGQAIHRDHLPAALSEINCLTPRPAAKIERSADLEQRRNLLKKLIRLPEAIAKASF